MNRPYGVSVETVVRLYCDGPPHNHTCVAMSGLLTQDRVDDIISSWGFTVTDDGKTFCHLHAPKGKTHSAFPGNVIP